MSNTYDTQTSIIIDALRLYQQQGLDTQGVDVDALCEKLNVGDISLIDTVKPLQSYHLVYKYIDETGEIVSDCDWGCEAEDLNHAVEQLINSLEGDHSGNSLLAFKATGQHADEEFSPLIQDDEDGYRLLGNDSDSPLQAYVRVGNIDIKIGKTDEGVVVDLFDRHTALETVATTYAFFSECAADDDLEAPAVSQKGLSQ